MFICTIKLWGTSQVRQNNDELAPATLTWTNSLSIIQMIGPCVLGDKCRYQHLQLRDAYKCKVCRTIVHPLCVSMGDLEDSTCNLCADKGKILNRPDSTSDNQQELCTIRKNVTPRNIVPPTKGNEKESTPQARRNPSRNVVPATPKNSQVIVNHWHQRRRETEPEIHSPLKIPPRL